MDPTLQPGLGRGRVAITGATTLDASHQGLTVDATSGTFTLSLTAAATLGAGWHCCAYNSGSGVVTLDPNAAETIRSATGTAATVALAQGQGVCLLCDGSNFDIIAAIGFAAAPSTALTVNDNAFTIQDNGDTTKKFQFEASGITTATTRTLTVLDANQTLAGSAAALTSGRVPYVTTGGLLTDSLSLVFSGAGAPTLSISDGSTAASAVLRLNPPNGSTAEIRFTENALIRFNIQKTSTGATLNFNAHDASGAFIDTPIAITNASGGNITFVRPLTTSGNLTQTGSTTLSTGTGVATYNYSANNFGGTMALSASFNATSYGINVTNTSNSAGASSTIFVNGDSTGNLLLVTWSSTNGGTTFGITRSGWSNVQAQGASTNGLMIGVSGVDKPIVFGQNTSESARFAVTTRAFLINTTTDDGNNKLQVAGGVAITRGTITTALQTLDSTVTWNAGGVTFTGWKLNLTDTASASASLLLDLQKASTSQFSVGKSGDVSALGFIRSTGATSGIGYATGAGGTVTQVTSRTTGVTLNKVCGAITLVSAAGSATYQSFTVTNSAVAATDVVEVNQKSGTDLYEIHVTNVAAGTFQITYRTTGGTTVEQPVFNFAIIKAVTA